MNKNTSLIVGRIMMVTAVLLVLLLLPLSIFTLVSKNENEAIKSQAIVQNEVEIWWDDSSHPQLKPIFFQSDNLTATQYLDIQARQGNNVITTTSKIFNERTFDQPGTGLFTAFNVPIDLKPGSYDMYCRLRIEVKAQNLMVGTNESNAVITTTRTFYGVYLNGTQLVSLDKNKYALCGQQRINYVYYLPIISR